MKRIKRDIYNMCPEFHLVLIILLITFLIEIVYFISNSTLSKIMFICMCSICFLSFFLFLIFRKVRARKFVFFKLTSSVLRPNCVWINQYKSKNGSCICPLKAFPKDLKAIMNEMQLGKTYYCVTHPVIIKQIHKHFEILEEEQTHSKSLKRLKKSLFSECCKKCNHNCILKESKYVDFYAIKFSMKGDNVK